MCYVVLQRVPHFLLALEDPLEEMEALAAASGIKGCAYCGGLGHRATNCPKLQVSVDWPWVDGPVVTAWGVGCPCGHEPGLGHVGDSSGPGDVLLSSWRLRKRRLGKLASRLLSAECSFAAVMIRCCNGGSLGAVQNVGSCVQPGRPASMGVLEGHLNWLL